MLSGLALAVTFAACGEQAVDAAQAEDEIAKDYEAQVPDADVEAVECPGEIDAEPGTTAVCTVTLADGTTGEIEIEVLDDDGRISWILAGDDGSGR